MEVNNNNQMQKLYEIASKQLQESGEITTPYVEIDTDSKEKEVIIENADEEVSVDFTDETSDSLAEQVEKAVKEVKNEDIIQGWIEQVYQQRQQMGISPEFTNLINPYQVQGNNQKLSFEDLVKIGEYYSGKTNKVDENSVAEQFLAQSAQSQSIRQAEVLQSAALAETQQSSTQDDKITTESTTKIAAENEIGSIDYVASALKMAIPDIDCNQFLSNYTMIYDSQGRVTALKNNGKYDTTQPDIAISYTNASDSKNVNNAMNIAWVNASGKAELICLSDFGDMGKSTIRTSEGSEDYEIRNYNKNGILECISKNDETVYYNEKGDVLGVTVTIKAGAAYTYKGITVTNTTADSITAAFNTTTEGNLIVSTMDKNENINVGTISYTAGDDSVSEDKVLIFTSKDGTIKSLSDYLKSKESSSTSASASSSSSTSGSSSTQSSSDDKVSLIKKLITALLELLESNDKKN